MMTEKQTTITIPTSTLLLIAEMRAIQNKAKNDPAYLKQAAEKEKIVDELIFANLRELALIQQAKAVTQNSFLLI
jgi:hypothetical protein